MRARFQDLSIRAKLTVIIAGSVAVLTAAILVLVWIRAEREVRQDIHHELADSQTAFTAMEGAHLREHAEETVADASQPTVAALLTTGDTAGACAYANGFIARPMPEAGHTDTFDYVALQRPDGALLALAVRGDPPCAPRLLRWQPAPVHDALSGQPLVTNWESPEDKLYEVIAAAVPGPGGALGTLAIGFQVNDDFARSVAQLTGSQAAFWHMDGDRVHVLGVSEPGLKQALVAAVENRTSAPQSMILPGPGGKWALLSAPIRDAADRMENPKQLHTALMESITAKLAPFRMLEQYLGLLALCALALGALFGAFIARPIAKPLTSLAAAAHGIQKGDYDVVAALGLEHNPRMQARDEIGVLARSFVEMVQGLKERFAMTSFLSRSAVEQIRQAAESNSGAAVASERRTLAVLFTDIRGFSSYAEHRDPAVVVANLNRVLGIQARLVRAHQGDVDKFIGDAMVAWFSGPGRCRRALRAAAAIAAQLGAELRQEPGTRVGLGLHVGEVVVGAIGSEERRDYTAIGSTVNLAARLCAAAGPGQVLVSAAVEQELRAAADAPDAAAAPAPDSTPPSLRPLAPLQFKGFSHPLPVFELKAEGSAEPAPPPAAAAAPSAG